MCHFIRLSTKNVNSHCAHVASEINFCKSVGLSRTFSQKIDFGFGLKPLEIYGQNYESLFYSMLAIEHKLDLISIWGMKKQKEILRSKIKAYYKSKSSQDLLNIIVLKWSEKCLDTDI